MEISDSIFLFLQLPLKKKKNQKKESIKNLLSNREFNFQNQRAEGGMVVNNRLWRLIENNAQCCSVSSNKGKEVILSVGLKSL